MNRPHLRDLERLSSAEKDALIVNLWKTLQALDCPLPVPMWRGFDGCWPVRRYAARSGPAGIDPAH